MCIHLHNHSPQFIYYTHSYPTSSTPHSVAHFRSNDQHTTRPHDHNTPLMAQGCSEAFVITKRAVAESVYKQEVARWEKDKSSSKTGNWVNTVVEAGTIRDKVNGLVVLVQQSPFHRIATLDQLLVLTQSPTTRVAILAIESIKDLFFASYLPDTKLTYFGKHFESMSEEEAEAVNIQQLVRWYYEDAVKNRYASFIQSLEKAVHSNLKEAKTVAIGTLQRMLIEKPEQEHTILSLLVDKMGDPHSKTANWTINLLLGVLQKHPNMKLVIVKEVQLFINKHSPLTTTIPLSLLSQIVLADGEAELANMLVSTYFRQLKVLAEQKRIKKEAKKASTEGKVSHKLSKLQAKKAKKRKEKEEKASEENKAGESTDTKMASVLLTGVNRAFPFAKLPQDVYESHLEILFSLVEHGGFNRKVLALVVILKVIKLQQEISDNLDRKNRTRFYHLLYDLLLSTELSSGFGQPTYKQAFFALVEGAIAADKDISRARAFVKRLLVMSAHARPGFACSSLLLASRLFQTQITSPLSTMVTSLTPPSAGNKPDPLFHSDGNNSCLWELCALRYHCHPLVAKWAQLLSVNQPISYTGQPIDDLSTNTFLSRFQNKQPSIKQRVKGKVVQLQPRKQPAAAVTFSFTVRDFQTKTEKDIRPDELYFFKYLQLKIANLEREDETASKHKKKGRVDTVSSEVLEGLLEVEAEDGDFGMNGTGLEDLDDDDMEEGENGGGGFGSLDGKRGAKRKEAPVKSKPQDKKSKPQDKKSKPQDKKSKPQDKKSKPQHNKSKKGGTQGKKPVSNKKVNNTKKPANKKKGKKPAKQTKQSKQQHSKRQRTK